ncbi:hypothetical protein QOZ88_05925 [Blastococcus sp. BMG 814]|uniref:Terminase small subunit n=1 Tax=Blastococcus carthaginiensis TaxID=3050034 RepID=A0ABT9I9C4_9ACTN|nr:hypothetical protein [Blastococcus carthaginiensis]MDP5182168.1 hypothetical protein [Blastococcus carthaginiensis]
MAGRGPAPKDPSKRVRRGSDQGARLVLVGGTVSQPELPDDVDWPAATRAWWKTWGEEPISSEFRATDWAFLAETALLHAAVWTGELKHMPELRLRVAKLGATLEDRARLRITFAQADEAEKRAGRPAPAAGGSARERYQRPVAVAE